MDKPVGSNIIPTQKVNFLNILFRQFTGNPLIIILAVATFISLLLGQRTSSYYIFAIIILSVILGFWNEYVAEKTIEDLLKKISPTTIVLRDGVKKEIKVADLIIGDLVFLSQGSIVPADLELTEAKNLAVDQAILTGEAKSVYKINSEKIYMGTTVVSGSAEAKVIAIGKNTELGKIAKAYSYLQPETEFQKGLNKFGRLIIKVVIILTIVIFTINAILGHQWLNSLLFSLAIAVGLTPELLPVIVTVSLSQGAGKLAKKGVIAKKLLSIENFGNMDILCTDKTGTLTEGKIEVVDCDSKVLVLALLATDIVMHHKIIGNDIDIALWNYAQKKHIAPEKKQKKIAEIPFDYERKATFCVATEDSSATLVVKGSPDAVLSFCQPKTKKKELTEKYQELNKKGLRVIAIATKKIDKKQAYSWSDVKDLVFMDYITFLDVPKKTAKEALEKLQRLNVKIKVITGDNEIITQRICNEVGLQVGKIILGSEIEKSNETDLRKIVMETQVFAKVNPEQKMKIIQALNKTGHTVGYLGDGINDVPSIHAAGVGISVNSAVDVAKDAASVVLLRKGLDVIADGITEGRRIFNNTIKYILMATSSNFGNMFSAAGASFFLPFLPMSPVQILLTNGLYDLSQIGIPTDNVEHKSLLKPKHWDIKFIRNYMLFFGPLSSIYDYITFGILIFLFHAKESLFQTGWFIESLITQILVVFVIRTARTPFFLSRPSIGLITSCLITTSITLILPFTPLAKSLGFIAPSLSYFAILIILSLTYLLLVELVKKRFLKTYQL